MEDGAAARREPKNIVLFSDGTGNSAGKLFRTNVWRLYTNLDLSNPEKQIAVWDTVAAYGMPIAELTRGIDDWIWPLSMPNYQLSTRSCRRAMLWR
jgi:Uncharacterized alpha/beta hydrolase domain (DUF2235)